MLFVAGTNEFIFQIIEAYQLSKYLTTDDIMDLLNLCLTLMCFQYNLANTSNSYMVQLWAVQFLLL